MKKTFTVICMLLVTLFSLAGCTQKEETNEFKIVTSFYPMYIIALNITEGAENISLENMADTNAGCLHDYTLKTSDLVKVENADVFIMNGLGIETFTDKILQTNENITVIDASEKLEANGNAHVWMDIDNYISQVEQVTEKLKTVNPENATVYEENKVEYIKKLELLKTEKQENEKVISFSDSLYYLENFDMKIVETDHEHSSMSAEKLKEMVDYAKQNNIKKVLVDNIASTKNAEVLANEIGAKVYVLDAFLSGEMQKDAYENMMKQNAKIMEE